MKKCIALFLALTFPAIAHAGRGLETWWDHNVIAEISNRAQFRLEQEYGFEHGFDRLYFHYSDEILYFKFFDWLFLGPYIRLIRGKVDGEWLKEARPGIIMRNWFKTGPISWFTRIKAYHRIIEQNKNRTATRWLLGADLFEHKKLSGFAAGEFFFNHFDTGGFDGNISILGVHGIIDDWFSWDVYCNFYSQKRGPGRVWRHGTAIATGFTTNF